MIFLIIYLVGAFLTGLFLKLNYDLEFFDVSDLTDFDIDDTTFWVGVLLWPLLIFLIIIVIGYEKLRDSIETQINKKQEENTNDNK